MVRKMAEEKTMVRIYGEADDTFGVFDEGEMLREGNLRCEGPLDEGE